MPVLEDPDAVLPNRRRLTPSQLIMALLYPVIFIVGLVVGLVIGIRQGHQQAAEQANQAPINSTVIPNANNRVTNTTVDANVNVSNVFLNSNNPLGGGDYLEIDPAVQAELNQQEQAEKDRVIDQSASLTDIIRQQDLITIKYRLKAYYSVKQVYPLAVTQIRLDRSSNDTLFVALKDFYGGSFNEPIDPDHPTYYYGYTSNGSSFQLTSRLVSKNKTFVVTDS